MRSRYADLQLQILHALYVYAFKEGSLQTFNEDDLGKVLPRYMILGITNAVLRKLAQDRFLDRDPDGYYSISDAGIEFVESELDDPYSQLSALLGNQTSEDATVSDRYEAEYMAPPIPAADRTVTLDHNSDPYKEAIGALDAALAAFREDRSFSNEWGTEKATLLRTLEAGRELLNDTTVRVATVYTTIVNPLRIIRERYADAIAAGLVTAAVDHLLPILERAVALISTLVG